MDEMNWIDYGIIGIISISVIFGMVRGFVREAMSLVTWVAAITIGVVYCEEVATWFTSISYVLVRFVLAFVLLVLLSLIVGGIINYLLLKLIKTTKFSITDKIVGVFFGASKGVVIVAGLILLVLLINPKKTHESAWQDSVLIPKFEPVSQWIKEMLPEVLLKAFQDPKKEDFQRPNSIFRD